MQVIYEKWKGKPLAARCVCVDEQGQEVTPAFDHCIPLYTWLRANGWKQAHNFDHGNETYAKGIACYVR